MQKVNTIVNMNLQIMRIGTTWYNSSDTSEDIPDPNLSAEALYQGPNKLPVPLHKSHFYEGLIYTMTLEGRENSMLVLITEVTEELVYQIFFTKGSGRTLLRTGKEKSRTITAFRG